MPVGVHAHAARTRGSRARRASVAGRPSKSRAARPGAGARRCWRRGGSRCPRWAGFPAGRGRCQTRARDGVRATTQLTTRAAPARFSVAAISSSVAPVVMTSSSTATVAPAEQPRAMEGAAHVLRALCRAAGPSAPRCRGGARTARARGARRSGPRPGARSRATGCSRGCAAVRPTAARGRCSPRPPERQCAREVAQNRRKRQFAAELERLHQHVGRKGIGERGARGVVGGRLRRQRPQTAPPGDASAQRGQCARPRRGRSASQARAEDALRRSPAQEAAAAEQQVRRCAARGMPA